MLPIFNLFVIFAVEAQQSQVRAVAPLLLLCLHPSLWWVLKFSMVSRLLG